MTRNDFSISTLFKGNTIIFFFIYTYIWPIEPLAPQLARANKKYKSTIDLMYAYAHTPLDEETIKLTGFSSGDKLYAFIRGFYGLRDFQTF